ncbi:hypothetical protein JCM5350_007933 [Sporobolomyces pararoseus]
MAEAFFNQAQRYPEDILMPILKLLQFEGMHSLGCVSKSLRKIVVNNLFEFELFKRFDVGNALKGYGSEDRWTVISLIVAKSCWIYPAPYLYGTDVRIDGPTGSRLHLLSPGSRSKRRSQSVIERLILEDQAWLRSRIERDHLQFRQLELDFRKVLGFEECAGFTPGPELTFAVKRVLQLNKRHSRAGALIHHALVTQEIELLKKGFAHPQWVLAGFRSRSQQEDYYCESVPPSVGYLLGRVQEVEEEFTEKLDEVNSERERQYEDLYEGFYGADYLNPPISFESLVDDNPLLAWTPSFSTVASLYQLWQAMCSSLFR